MSDEAAQLNLGLGGTEDSVPVSRVPKRAQRKRAARDRQLIDHPQTRLKLAAYAAYLPEWLGVMAGNGADIFVIDLFAGPGQYQVGDGRLAAGSPLIACDAALMLEERERARGRRVRVHLRFVERSRRTRSILADALSPYAGRLDYELKAGQASAWAPQFAAEARGHPTLVLMDPDGYKDVPMSLVGLFARRRYTEVLISFDVQGYVRAAGLQEANSLSAFCGDDMWRRDRGPDGSIDVDRFLEGYRQRLAPGLFPRATIRRIVFSEVHANRAIAQACGSEKGVVLWKSAFAGAFDDGSGQVQVLDIVRQVDRRARIDSALELISALSGSYGVRYGAIRHQIERLDLDEGDTHQLLLFLRDRRLASWTSWLSRWAEPPPVFAFGEVPSDLRWDGVERAPEAALRVQPRAGA